MHKNVQSNFLNTKTSEKGKLKCHKGTANLAMVLALDRTLKTIKNDTYKICWQGFPGGAVVENLPANAGDTGSSPDLGRSHMPRSN